MNVPFRWVGSDVVVTVDGVETPLAQLVLEGWRIVGGTGLEQVSGSVDLERGTWDAIVGWIWSPTP